MQFRSLVLAALASASASAQSSDACAAGAILGIFALCGSKPVDCGSNKCCLEGQKCVPADGDFKCADSALVQGATVTVNAACYGTSTASISASKPPSQSASATPTSKSVKPSPPGSAIPSATGSGHGGGYGPGSSSSPSSVPSSSSSPAGGVYAPGASTPAQSEGGYGASSASAPAQSEGGYGGPKPTSSVGYTPPFSGSTVISVGVVPSVTSSRGPVLATANAAPNSYSSPNSKLAAMLSAMGLLAFWL